MFSEEDLFGILRGLQHRELPSASSPPVSSEEESWVQYKSRSTAKTKKEGQEQQSPKKIKEDPLNSKCHLTWASLGYLASVCPARSRREEKPLRRQTAPVAGEAKAGARKNEMVARIKLTRAMVDQKLKFSKKFGVIRVVFGEPTAAEIVDGLQEASDSFKVWISEGRHQTIAALLRSSSTVSP